MKKINSKIIIGLIVGLIVLLGIGLAVWQGLFSNVLGNNSASNSANNNSNSGLDTPSIVLVDNHLFKPDAELNEASLSRALDRFKLINDTYLSASTGRVFLTVIPEKDYYLSQDNPDALPGIMNYGKLFSTVSQDSWYQYIDITDTLSLDDYYYSDNHWKQECITDTAAVICNAIGSSAFDDAELKHDTICDFTGVYKRDSNFDCAKDSITVLRNEMIDSCTVTNTENDQKTLVYDLSKVSTDNTYDVYLSGAKAIEFIDNPACTTGRELIIFRDSYGSSIAPLLLKDYSKVTLIDIRYIMTDLIQNYVEFNGQDVLFIYSSSVLNRSRLFK